MEEKEEKEDEVTSEAAAKVRKVFTEAVPMEVDASLQDLFPGVHGVLAYRQARLAAMERAAASASAPGHAGRAGFDQSCDVTGGKEGGVMASPELLCRRPRGRRTPSQAPT